MGHDLINDEKGRHRRLGGGRLLLVVMAAMALCAPAAATASEPVPRAPGAPTLIPPPPPDPTIPTGYLIVTVAFEGGFTTPASTPDKTPSEIADTVLQDLNPWFTQVSHGVYRGRTPTLGGMVTLKPQEPVCSNPWRREIPELGAAKLRSRGIEPSNFQAVIYYFSGVASCAFGGVASFPENGNFVLLNGTTKLEVLAHEIGHNLGLGHAGSHFCADSSGTRVTLNAIGDGRCSQKEYGDEYNAMGDLGSYGYASPQRTQLGWNAGRVVTIGANTPPVTIFLTPLSTLGATLTQAVHLVDQQTNLWLEYRQPTGVDGAPPAQLPGGLLVRAELFSIAHAEHVGPFLLDMTPLDGDHTRFGKWSPEMTVGQSWSNPQGNLKITLNSATTLGASVTIEPSVVLKTVPDVRGQTAPAATTTITTAGLTRRTISTVVDPLCENLTKVIIQTPAPGTRLPAGSPVDIQTGVAPASGCPDTDQ